MDIIIKKIDIIDDVKKYIYNYCYDNCGYTIDEIKKINQLKILKKNKFIRIKIELWAWKKSNLSIGWLRPTNRHNMGYYSSIFDEIETIKSAYNNKFIDNKTMKYLIPYLDIDMRSVSI